MTQDPFNIILVEDAAADVFLVRQALEKDGLNFQLRVLEDGEEAVDFIEDLDRNEDVPCPDVMLLDLNLPKKTGDQVLERMRTSPVQTGSSGNCHVFGFAQGPRPRGAFRSHPVFSEVVQAG